jgi:23S rRNA pseudouridine1911/1915/1917 synthase
MLKNGIKINDKSVTLYSFPLKPGDIIETSSHSRNAERAGLSFPVLYEDKNIIVVEKPAGKPTSSTDGSLSIYEIISEYLRKQSKGKTRAYVVHRLDKEVSGVLLFAKSREAMEKIKENWIKTEKHYYALVEGIPEKDEGTIKSWLIEDKAQKMHSTHETANAKFSITSYKILKRLKNYGLLDVKTDTGRKNQIRVHLSDIGCPIVGDRKYGASDDFIRRIRLHAYSLSFPHPENGEMMTVLSPMPNGFLSLKSKDEDYK